MDVITQKHYAKYEIEPIEYLNALLTNEELKGHYWATALVYLSRFKDKGGREDLAKAKVYIDLLDDLLMWEETGQKRPSGNPIYRIYKDSEKSPDDDREVKRIKTRLTFHDIPNNNFIINATIPPINVKYNYDTNTWECETNDERNKMETDG